MKQSPLNKNFTTTALASTLALALTACSGAETSEPETSLKASATAEIINPTPSASAIPADKFDLSHWRITVPLDDNNDGKADSVKTADIQSYSHPDFFFVTESGEMVFTSPNKATTTPNSSNTRSELRYMLRGDNTKLKTSGPGNNFALRAHPDVDGFGSIGGRMEASLDMGMNH